MKILVVTSEVTFVPNNYNLFLQSFFEGLGKDCSANISLIVLENNSFNLIFKGLALVFMGVKRLGLHLIKNSLMSHTLDHQRMAKRFGVKTLYFKNPNDLAFISYVKKEKIDLIINARTRYIYRKDILSIPTIGCLNIHHGLLPDYRGIMCDLYALYENRPAGFSIHKMESKIDNGDILLVKEVTIPDQQNSKSLNFCLHIKESSRIEGLELSKIVKNIISSKKLPIINKNISTNIHYTKNPNYKKIRKMINKGIIL